MANKDYEQKKRECWEECAAKVAVETTNLLCKAIAYSAFDRAYALGREKETISQEEIYNQFKEKVRNNDFLADQNNPSFVDRYIEYTKVYKWVVNTLGKKIGISEFYDTEDTVIHGWVARDADGDAFLYQNEPDRHEIAWNGYMMHSLPIDSFPDITWESEPEPVEIIIKRKKNG